MKTMKTNRWMLLGVVGMLSAVGAWSLAHSSLPSQTAPLAPLVLDFDDFQDGDLIFRRGTGNLSRMVLSTDPDSLYSHVGLVSLDGSEVWVIHATPGESFTEKTPVQRETLAEFLAPEKAQAAAVARIVEGPAVAERATRAANRYFDRRLPFDADLDLDTNTALYCTELVWKAYLEGGVDLVEDRRYRSRFLGSEVLLPSGILESPGIQMIHQYRLRSSAS
jgi:hypothetical protein